MKLEIKLVLFGLFFSILCMIGFHLLFYIHLKDIYVCQVGIYALEENKNAKVYELNEAGYDAYTYVKDNQYYVLSMMSEDINEIETLANEVNGIVKTYRINDNISYEDLLNQLEEGNISD
ncbi:MAG: hypothetical protein LUF02_04325 [Erysipelotrichaceae bacterium]|nr:hypothetical protein [Erysipelotrichaceae bacterium]